MIQSSFFSDKKLKQMWYIGFVLKITLKFTIIYGTLTYQTDQDKKKFVSLVSKIQKSLC